jgi:CDP-glucose 4,6-dehydratase
MSFIESLNKFYKNKKILVTGHTGFKGSWLSMWLENLGADVSGYALEADKISLFELAGIKNSINSAIGDIRDYDSFFAAVKKFQPEIIFHLAAQPLVRESYHAPIETYQTNVMGTINLFEIVRKVGGIKAIVNVTTDKCYENKNLNIAFKENDKLGGYDPYSSSKACSEIVTSCWRDSFFTKEGIALASARAGNVIGGGDFCKDRIIPDIIKAIEKNEKVILRNPNATRPWQHVLEPILGYMILAMQLFQDQKNFSSAYNFGPDVKNIMNVETVTQNFIESVGSGSYEIRADEQLYEAKTLRLDNNKARSELGWKPIFDFLQTINFTANWYRNYLNGCDDVRNFTNTQIEEYIKECQFYY